MADECARVSELASDIQALSHRLHSSKLKLLGLAAAARGFCAEVTKLEKVEVDFRCEHLPKGIPEETSLCLFRVLQEALQNAVKHSGSRRFQVSLSNSSTQLELAVRDWGCGFGSDVTARKRGLGLTSMRERLKLVGGQLSIESRPGAGTTIRATAPLRLASHPRRTVRQTQKTLERSA
jgi:signal transduction histidine kinase